MIRHTKTPWRAKRQETHSQILAGHGRIADCLQWSGRSDRPSGDEAFANARRIAACVNACEGIGTEILENGARHDWGQLMAELERQRDQLLEALESLILFTPPKKSNAAALNHAYQAVAAVRGAPPL